MTSPLLHDKVFAEPSAFIPENLLREARRQKGLPIGSVPGVCVLDPDGDILRDLIAGAGRFGIRHGRAITPTRTWLAVASRRTR